MVHLCICGSEQTKRKHNRLKSSELLSNDWPPVRFGSSQLGLWEASGGYKRSSDWGVRSCNGGMVVAELDEVGGGGGGGGGSPGCRKMDGGDSFCESHTLRLVRL